MNDPMAAPVYTKPHRSNRAFREQDRSSLRRDYQAKSEFNWEPQKRSFRETVLYWGRRFGCIYHALCKPRLPQGYYSFISDLGLSRGKALFYFMGLLGIGTASFNVTTNLINGMPEVDLIAHAQASETIQSNKYRKTDKDGFFLEDCY